MIIGGYAIAFHGYPRFTKDIDLYYYNSAENIALLKVALLEFGFADSDVPEHLFEQKDNIIRFGVPPVQVDVINEIKGVVFEEAERNIIRGRYGQIETNFIGRKDLIRNKRATGRSQDKVDAKMLEQGDEDRK